MCTVLEKLHGEGSVAAGDRAEERGVAKHLLERNIGVNDPLLWRQDIH